jgi:hypothetical protein
MYLSEEASAASSQDKVMPSLSMAMNRPGVPELATVSPVQSNPSSNRFTTELRGAGGAGDATETAARRAVATVALVNMLVVVEK